MPRFIARAACAAVLAIATLGAAAQALTVSAAASLTHAFRDIGAAFEARHPGTRVQFNFGASGALLQQIAKGAPVDVFASADQETMDQAQQRLLVRPEARRDFARNSLVAIVPQEAAATPRALNDLAAAKYTRIAIGLPASVPAGRHARAALEKARLWAAIAPRTIGASSVRQALDYVARAEVDAGFVYATDAALMPGKVRVAFRVPTETPILYPIAPLASAARPADAAKFVAFVLTPEAQALLARHGFGKP